MGGGLSKLPLRLEGDADDDEDGTNHNLPSSIHKVLSNDDLLMEILLRLPIISLHLFKPVCKQWLSLITSPSFTLTRTRIPNVDPPSGLFIRRWSPNSNEYDYDFVSFNPRIPGK
ncbi:cytosolic glyceraldehyde-3-phosphate dehydrogenase, partial [Tanacetum coccineum]